MFDHIIGNQKAKDYLLRISERGMVGNSLLFGGVDGIGKSLFAEAFAKLLLCMDDPQGTNRRKIESGNHPDIHVYRPEGKIGMHSIASMRQFNEEVYMAPYEAKWKVFIIHDADRMLSYSANALLKTFEEPAQDALIILLSSSPAALLPTVLSRCRSIFFNPLSEQEIVSFVVNRFNKTEEEAEMIAGMSQGSVGQAVRLANQEVSPVRGLLLDFLQKGQWSHFKELSGIAAEIADRIESEKKEIEVEIRKTLLKGAAEDLSAAQKQGLEKEVDGAVTMHAKQEAYVLFEIVLAWYRDAHLLKLNGNPAYLMHRDYVERCRQFARSNDLMSLEAVQKAVAEVKLLLERSTSLQICLENLFLKLHS